MFLASYSFGSSGFWAASAFAILCLVGPGPLLAILVIMLPLAKTLEVLALTLPRFDTIDHVGTALALIYKNDIEMLPLRSLKTSIGRAKKLTDQELKKLVVCVLRDLQEWGRTILVEAGLGDEDDRHGRHNAFAAAHAKVIQDAWDNLPDAPVWAAFERQFEQLGLRYARRG
jgi:hypothetical protein